MAQNKEKRPQCTAKSKQTGERCKKTCVPGKKVCRYHGGLSPGAPKGSKNALKHGAYEKINREACFEDELKLVDKIDFDPIETLKEQIKMLRIKIFRIAKRMKQALIAENEVGKVDKNGKKKSPTVLLSVSTIQTKKANGDPLQTTITSNSETHSMFYLRLEQVHTALMAELRRAMNNLAQLEAEQASKIEAEGMVGVLVTPGILTEAEWEKAAGVSEASSEK